MAAVETFTGQCIVADFESGVTVGANYHSAGLTNWYPNIQISVKRIMVRCIRLPTAVFLALFPYYADFFLPDTIL